jgi:tRNA A37 N6-isopentenylltransferase MiaA
MCKPRKLRLDPREVSRLASLGSDRLHAFLLKVDPRYRAEIAKIEAGERAAPREGGEA